MIDLSRYERLRADLDALRRLREQSTIFDFQVTDESDGPPEKYLLTFRGKGATRKDTRSPVVIAEFHQVEIAMGPFYPTLEPAIRWKTPLFHPNVTDRGEVFFGGWGQDWVAGLGLDALCERLWDITRYTSFDTTRPLNFAAAEWARTQASYKFPLDTRPLRDKLSAATSAPSNVIVFEEPGEREATALSAPSGTRVSRPVYHEEGIEFLPEEPEPPPPAPPRAPSPPRVVRVPILTDEEQPATEERKKEEPEPDILFLDE